MESAEFISSIDITVRISTASLIVVLGVDVATDVNIALALALASTGTFTPSADGVGIEGMVVNEDVVASVKLEGVPVEFVDEFVGIVVLPSAIPESDISNP